MYLFVYTVIFTKCYLFFFQAEDGIRDRNVTGVQTCALPIFAQPGGTCAPEGCPEVGLGALVVDGAREVGVDLLVAVAPDLVGAAAPVCRLSRSTLVVIAAASSATTASSAKISGSRPPSKRRPLEPMAVRRPAAMAPGDRAVPAGPAVPPGPAVPGAWPFPPGRSILAGRSAPGGLPGPAVPGVPLPEPGAGWPLGGSFDGRPGRAG